MSQRIRNLIYIFHKIPKIFLWFFLCGIVFIYCLLFYNNLVKPYSYRWKALYGKTSYPYGYVRGIDISHYQKLIDWSKLSNAKIQGNAIDFIFIKATEGNEMQDTLFNFNFNKARSHNLIRGAYHFFTTQSCGLEQAKFFCRTVKLESGDLPPVLDIEFDKFNSVENDNSLKKEILNWLFYVENYYRVKPIIYASFNFKTSFLKDKVFDDYPYWIAHYYVDTLSYEKKWRFWQHTDAGHVDGIDDYVDIDLFNGNKNDLIKMCIK